MQANGDREPDVRSRTSSAQPAATSPSQGGALCASVRDDCPVRVDGWLRLDPAASGRRSSSSKANARET